MRRAGSDNVTIGPKECLFPDGTAGDPEEPGAVPGEGDRMTFCSQTLASKDPSLSPEGWTHLETKFSEVWGLEALQRAGRGLTDSKGLLETG